MEKEECLHESVESKRGKAFTLALLENENIERVRGQQNKLISDSQSVVYQGIAIFFFFSFFF